MLPDVTDHGALNAQVEAVRASGVLGRSHTLVSLFDYLVAASLEGRSPKEAEIAVEVFGKTGKFDTGEDAVVRVYIHRLRQKLTEFARDKAQLNPVIALPKGEYRLVLQARDGPQTDEADPVAPKSRSPGLPRWASVAAVVIACVAAWLMWERVRPAPSPAASAMWRPFVKGRFPLVVVTGDYYIFGESDDGVAVSRLVREYEVNSPEDLDVFRREHPERAHRYMDLGLRYLPVSTAEAMSDMAPLFTALKPDQVIPVAQVTPSLLKTHDVIYVGYISGLGSLLEATFAGSRYRVGDNFDELTSVDGKTRWVSQGALGPVRHGVYRDYAYVSVFPGPAGNRIAVIAGLRDLGAIAAAKAATDPAGLKVLSKPLNGAPFFEAFYEVQGQGDVEYRTRLLSASVRPGP